MKYVGIAIATIFLTANIVMPNSCSAEEYLITQHNIQFNPIIKVVKPGDIIKFKNNDNVTHNIISLTKDFEFDLGKFKPGMTKSVQFKQKGVVDVQCTIHPEMKMTIFVF